MKNILITGGLGYIGGQLTGKLASTGKYKLDISTRGAETVHTSLVSPGITYVPAITELQSLAAYDVIVHLAAHNEIQCEKDPVSAAQFNIVESLRFLQKAIAAGTKKFIYFSTAHVYCSPLTGNINENSLPRPIHPYAISHKAFEDFVLAARDKKLIEGVVLRLSNAFGKPYNADVDRWSLLVNDLCRQAVRSNVLKLTSDGSQLRNFITLSDVSDAVAWFIDTDASCNSNGLFNLGSNRTMSVLEMAELIVDRAGITLNKELTIEFPSSAGKKKEPGHLFYSIEKLEKTGFTWKNNFEDEIDRLLVFCREHFTS